MNTEAELTSPCGLYCDDCLPGDNRFFEDLDRFRQALSRYGFREYAVLKAETTPAFNDYPVMEKLLEEMALLRCRKPCRLGGGKPVCGVRDCVAEKGLAGCWDCPEMEGCTRLDHLRKFHELDHNLKMIKRHGVDDWSAHRGKHYLWL